MSLRWLVPISASLALSGLLLGCFSDPPPGPTGNGGSTSDAGTGSGSSGRATTTSGPTGATSSADEGTTEDDGSGGLADDTVVVYRTQAAFSGDLEAQSMGDGLIAYIDGLCEATPEYNAHECNFAVAILEVPNIGFYFDFPDLPFAALDGTPIADDGNDFMFGEHENTLTEAGIFADDEAIFWTGAGDMDCMSWEVSMGAEAVTGSGNATGPDWLSDGRVVSCGDQLPLLCTCWEE